LRKQKESDYFLSIIFKSTFVDAI
jgi:hypothetical protein